MSALTLTAPSNVETPDTERLVTMPVLILAVTISTVSKSTTFTVAYVPTKEVTTPAVILALTISPSLTSIVVIVAPVPTISVTARPVMFAEEASKVSVSRVVIVPRPLLKLAIVPTPVILIFLPLTSSYITSPVTFKLPAT